VSRGLRVGIDARELSGRPTGTGRYLRNLLRQWTGGPSERDRFIAYTNGPPPDDAVLSHHCVEVRPVGDGRSRGIVWQERELPAVGSVEFRVLVDGQPAGIRRIGASEPDVGSLDELPGSIDVVFDLVERQVGADRVDVHYDPDLGYPVSVVADRMINAVDDEFEMRISDFTVATKT
jgi:hypothetical protein